MYRFFWFVAGAITSYVASGYLEGLLDEDGESHSRSEVTE